MAGFNSSHGGYGNNHPGGGGNIAAQLRPPAKRFLYFQENSGEPRPEIVGEEAENVARELKALPASQLRRFYSAAMALKRQLELDHSGRVTDEEVRTRLGLLKAQAAYTCKRGRNYPLELVAFFTRHADAVRKRDDFLRGFCRHFEAVVAYHKVFEDRRGNAE
jgi:CRISPR type III-A-associated protein Csm2